MVNYITQTPSKIILSFRPIASQQKYKEKAQDIMSTIYVNTISCALFFTIFLFLRVLGVFFNAIIVSLKIHIHDLPFHRPDNYLNSHASKPLPFQNPIDIRKQLPDCILVPVRSHLHLLSATRFQMH